ncbi:MAG: hypothetical protein EBT64_00735, partial [Gammaproteobacteria bacterium]|nr:hypothetical protein [Gammaproteobacteria bacterium]
MGEHIALAVRIRLSFEVSRFDFATLAHARGRKLRVIGNLPYNVSTPLLFHLLDHRASIFDLHVMLQREVIERICAAPGNGDYGRLTVMLAPWVTAEHLFDVGPGAFRPAPQVWSAVARLTVRETPAFPVDARYARVVSAAFLASTFFAFILSVMNTTVANTAVTMSLAPLMAALAGLAFLGERVAARTWVAIAVAG